MFQLSASQHRKRLSFSRRMKQEFMQWYDEGHNTASGYHSYDLSYLSSSILYFNGSQYRERLSFLRRMITQIKSLRYKSQYRKRLSFLRLVWYEEKGSESGLESQYRKRLSLFRPRRQRNLFRGYGGRVTIPQAAIILTTVQKLD